MKLKKAMKIAKNLSKRCKWIAVDEDKKIWSFPDKPTLATRFYVLDSIGYILDEGYYVIGNYTGKKNWKKTLRRVR